MLTVSRALLYLVGLQFWGWLRFLRDNLKTVRGALLGSLGLGMLAVWLLTVLALPGSSALPQADMARFGPAFLLLYCVATVLFSPHDRSIYFTPAEVQFLFSGPFSRRQILAYKVFLTLIVSLPTSFILGVALRVRHGWLPAVAIGWFMLIVFLQLFTLVLGLAGTAIGATLHTRGRRIGGVLLGLAAALAAVLAGNAAGWDMPRMADAVLGSRAWQAIVWPVRAFFDALVAQRWWPDLLVPALAGLALDAALLVALFALDVRFEEASAASSAAVYARILRAQGKQANVEPQAGKERRRRRGLPMLPWMGGVGPVLWRQLMTAWRAPGRLSLLLLLMAGMVAAPLGAARGGEADLLGVLLMATVWLTLFLPVLVPFDFRGDIDRMAALKTLPLPAWRLALGQMLAPTLLMTLVLWGVLGALLAAKPGSALLLASCAGYAPAFCFYQIALDNLAFLLFPVRLHAATPGDFQAVGRNILLMLAKLAGLAVPAILVGVGVLAGSLAKLPWLWLTVAGPLTLAAGAMLVLMAGLAFDAYEAGRNAPA